MIVRMWGGKVPLEYATRFHRHLLETGVKDYRKQSGCTEIKLLRRDADRWANFRLISVWTSMSAVHAYAGQEAEIAVLYPGDPEFGLIPDAGATHYDVLSLESADLPGRLADLKPSAITRPVCDHGAFMARIAHNSSRLAKPVGPFSHAVHENELVYLSGQVAQVPDTGKLVEGGFAEQARQIFRNFRVLLAEMGLTFDDVVKVNVFLDSMGNFEPLNKVYAEHFAAPYPARTTVAVKELPMSALVEMEMIVRAH